MVKTFTTVTTIVIFLGLLRVCVTSRQCSLGFRTHILSHEDCVPRRVLSRQCAGFCLSMNQIGVITDADDNSSCVSCEVSEMVIRRVSLMCPDNNKKERFIPVIFNVSIPHQCSCSLCKID